MYPVSSSGNVLQTIIQYHNQDIDIVTVKIQNRSNTTGCQDPLELSFSCCPFITMPTFLLPSSLPWPPGNCSSVLHCYNIVISRILHKYSHMLCNLFSLAFSTVYNSLQTEPGCYMLMPLLQLQVWDIHGKGSLRGLISVFSLGS